MHVSIGKYIFFLFESQTIKGVFHIGRGQHDWEGYKNLLNLLRCTLFSDYLPLVSQLCSQSALFSNSPELLVVNTQTAFPILLSFLVFRISFKFESFLATINILENVF